MNYFELITTILRTAKKHVMVEEVYYGDIYSFENQTDRKYSNFVLTVSNCSVGEDITTYSFNAFVTDRLTDDKSNLLEVQSASKTTLEQILLQTFDNLDSITYTFWTEKFNDLCAGCYASFSISLPNELICVDDDLFTKVVKEITTNGEYSVDGFDTVKVNVQVESLQNKEITVSENGITEVTADAGYNGLQKVSVVCDYAGENLPFSIKQINTSQTIFDFSLYKLLNKITFKQLFYQNVNPIKEAYWSKPVTVDSLNNCVNANTILEILDTTNWDCSNVTSSDNFLQPSATKLTSLIGKHTLEEVESGKIVACSGLGSQRSLDYGNFNAPNLRYSSILALANGMANRTGKTQVHFILLKTTFNSMFNDDGTTPDADTLAERQAKIQAICAEKNWLLDLR